MTYEELHNVIDDILDYVENGVGISAEGTHKGHPGFFYFHTKEEMQNELTKIIDGKEKYTRYDLYYYVQYIFKCMIGRYDSHTTLSFKGGKIPFMIKLYDHNPYIVDTIDEYKYVLGGRIISINGVNIETIKNEIDSITCYATNNYLNVSIETGLTRLHKLRSLPSLRNSFNMDYEVEVNGEIKHVIINPCYFPKGLQAKGKPNFNLEIINNIGIITYNSCRNREKMKELVEVLKASNLQDFIIDIRGNEGGDSMVHDPLVEFLKDKNSIMLLDEYVFSSARMFMIDLIKIGVKSIGTTPGTPINCFGSNVIKKSYDDLYINLNVSSTYWLYDTDLELHGIRKDTFENVFKGKEELLEPRCIEVDEKIVRPLSDYLDGKDTVLDTAIDRIIEKRNSKNI